MWGEITDDDLDIDGDGELCDCPRCGFAARACDVIRWPRPGTWCKDTGEAQCSFCGVTFIFREDSPSPIEQMREAQRPSGRFCPDCGLDLRVAMIDRRGHRIESCPRCARQFDFDQEQE